MSDINTGGPAFPTGDNPESRLMAEPGMTLRDYFAAKALAALIAREPTKHDDDDEKGLVWSSNPEQITNFAVRSYMFADAMIEARDGDTDLEPDGNQTSTGQ